MLIHLPALARNLPHQMKFLSKPARTRTNTSRSGVNSAGRAHNFKLRCACMRNIFSCVRFFTKGGANMFNPHLCNLMAGNRTGAGYSDGCWSSTGATTAPSGEAGALSAQLRATSPISTSATSSTAGSRNRASARSTRSQGRWGYRWRSGSIPKRSIRPSLRPATSLIAGGTIGRC